MELTLEQQLLIPILSPFFHGKPDVESMHRLMDSVEPYVDVYVPCLSSGEGNIMNDEQWAEVVRITVEHAKSSTGKPVYAGIKRPDYASTLVLAKQAVELGANGIVVPIPSNDDAESIAFIQQLANEQDLPIIVYNTETQFMQTIETARTIAGINTVVAIKDSSDNIEVFNAMCAERLAGTFAAAVLQGMEHRLQTPEGCDGYLIALLNVEPELCKEIRNNPTDEMQQKMLNIFWEYNLGGDWFISLKALAKERGLIRSAEQVEQFVQL